jgi:hypothetical protein
MTNEDEIKASIYVASLVWSRVSRDAFDNPVIEVNA